VIGMSGRWTVAHAVGALALVCGTVAASWAQGAGAAVSAPVYGYDVVTSYPHDPMDVHAGPHLPGRVPLREHRTQRAVVAPEGAAGDGAVVQRRAWTPATSLKDSPTGRHLAPTHLVHQHRIRVRPGVVLPETHLQLSGRGWGLTHDGRRLIMSDGTSVLRFLDPVTQRELGRLQVRDGRLPVEDLNELEFVKGRYWPTCGRPIASP